MDKLNLWHDLFCPKATPVTSLGDFMGVKISVKRDDLNHRIIQGNKLRKLKYNFKYLIENKHTSLATFGGAFSNHLVATAFAAKLCGIESTGFIRGDELQDNTNKWSDTLKTAKGFGMKLTFLTRQEYRLKHQSEKVEEYLKIETSKPYLIPEGGSNALALLGVEEIIQELNQQITEPTHIITACGTGGTLSGLIDGVAKKTTWHSQLIGVAVLKGASFLIDGVKKLSFFNKQLSWQIVLDYHAGGYGKINADFSHFGQGFVKQHGIKLDKIYTVKSFYATYDLIKKGEIKPGSHVIILHTGGLQGGFL
jgi:1-aminocyclopropane-1-carboxylate deaminase/D-cysteine desulfhydrase-like pyridoxal-dependent ACC family enzyme